jgi:hypothetical protein
MSILSKFSFETKDLAKYQFGLSLMITLCILPAYDFPSLGPCSDILRRSQNFEMQSLNNSGEISEGF